MINIAATIDDNMAIPLAVEYDSILTNNQDSQFDFYIVDDDLSDKSKDLLLSLEKVYPNCHMVTFLRSCPEKYKKANTSSPDSNIVENTYYRVEIPEEVSVSRILYLDADMICLGDLKPLWDAKLGSNAIGAVEDAGYVDRLKKMDVTDKPGEYFNDGLILIDVNKWNKDGISEKVRDLCNEKPEMLKYQEQDALSAVFDGKWTKLDPKFNLQSHLVKHENGENPIPERRKAEADALKNPTIIHYTNFEKPWIIKNNRLHPLRKYYDEYKNDLILHFGSFAENS